ncbi:hypothetical protein [Streptomyces cirratus]|uniref:hypothetical protein n=1 Tax=Streptomyces cirratus TaxID=68187 RepID=UPI00361EB120
MPGCIDPWLGFPPGIRKILTPGKQQTNDIWNKEVAPALPPADAAVMKKRFEPFSVPAMLEARQGKLFTDFYTPATRIRALAITDVVGRIKAPTLVLDYDDEQFYPGQPRRLYDKLTGPKDYLEADRGRGCAAPLLPDGPATALRGRLRLAAAHPVRKLNPRAGAPGRGRTPFRQTCGAWHGGPRTGPRAAR